MTTLSLFVLIVCLIPLGYLYLLALASLRPGSRHLPSRNPTHLFIVAIPAHDEAGVIEATIRRLKALDYPAELFSIHVVADHCSDNTADLARRAGACVHERTSGQRSGKGAALSYLFQRVLNDGCDAVVVFDSDTRVDSEFLRVMDARLEAGDTVIQGAHIIGNPGSGWYPVLTWAMFLIDNRFQNLGRANLGCSAKHMGDSICLRADVLRKIGWGEGLTEDYELRQRLLLEGVTISYESGAKGFGEAPLTWAQAKAQRARWLRGTRDASREHAKQLLFKCMKIRSCALMDGVFQVYLPCYSTLTMLSLLLLFIQIICNWIFGPVFSAFIVVSWCFMSAALFLYPLIGLALERAPLRAYLAIMSGPLFILWRTWLAVSARLGRGPATWIRTTHGELK